LSRLVFHSSGFLLPILVEKIQDHENHDIN
jgi:hypothetical protein